MEKLSNKQEKVLNEIKKFIAKNGYSPTIRELCTSCNLTSTATIYVFLEKLVNKGYINQNKGKFRTIELLVPNEYDKKNELYKVPLINDENNESIDLPGLLLSRTGKVVVIKAKDNTMSKVGINKDDKVIIAKTSDALNNDIVAYYNEKNEIIIRRYFKEKGEIKLITEEENPQIKKVNDIVLLGTAVGVYKEL